MCALRYSQPSEQSNRESSFCESSFVSLRSASLRCVKASLRSECLHGPPELRDREGRFREPSRRGGHRRFAARHLEVRGSTAIGPANVCGKNGAFQRVP